MALSEFPQHWAALTIHCVGDDEFSLAYLDDTERFMATAPERGGGVELVAPFDGRYLRFWAPLRIKKALAALLRDIPLTQPSDRRDLGPVPLAVFVEGAALLPAGGLTLLHAALHRVADYNRVQMVGRAREQGTARGRLRLPLRTLVFSSGEDEIDRLRGRFQNLFARYELLKEFGLTFHRADPLFAPADLAGFAADVALIEAGDLDRFLLAASDLVDQRLEESVPRLVIVVGAPLADRTRARRIPVGISLLFAPTSEPLEHASEVLFAFTHDRALHEAVCHANRITGSADAVLLSDPVANQSLRLSDAFSGLVTEALDLETAVDWDSVDDLLRVSVPEIPFWDEGLDGGAPGEEESGRGGGGAATRAPTFPSVSAPGGSFATEAAISTAAARAAIATVRISAETVQRMYSDFTFERQGLLSLARAEAGIAGARTARQVLAVRLTDLAAEDPAVQARLNAGKRSVDCALERVDYSPLAVRRPAADAVWLGKRVLLRRQARYRLCVRIGAPFAASLMSGRVASIDPLLPPSLDGHWLEVVLFPLDFQAAGSTSQPLLLPPQGPSEEVWLDLIAPPRDGPAQLRFGVYFQNHLVQSFLLNAHVAPEEAESQGKAVLTIEMVFSRTESFANLGDLGRRALSVAVNESPATAAHAFMLKCGDTTAEVRLAESILKKQVESFRAALAAQKNKQGEPLYPAKLPAGQPPPAAAVALLRKLATVGAKLHKAIFVRDQSGELKAGLRALLTTSDQSIQVVRHDPSYAFPWPVLYDRELPRVDAKHAPVCWNVVPGKCPHKDDDPVYCALGFWGIRHHIEQLCRTDGGDPVRFVVSEPRGARVQVVNAIATPATGEMVTELQRELSAEAVVDVLPSIDLIAHLWDDAKRPAQLIVIAHGELDDEAVRLVLVPESNWLSSDAVTDRELRAGAWTAPRSVVLLMACRSASTTLETPNDLTMAFDSAGAAAVIGTECSVFSDVAARFAREITLRLWKGRHFGPSMTEARRVLMGEGNPLGLAFCSVGDADLTLYPWTAA
jgi:hypothetical protein